MTLYSGTHLRSDWRSHRRIISTEFSLDRSRPISSPQFQPFHANHASQTANLVVGFVQQKTTKRTQQWVVDLLFLNVKTCAGRSDGENRPTSLAARRGTPILSHKPRKMFLEGKHKLKIVLWACVETFRIFSDFLKCSVRKNRKRG